MKSTYKERSQQRLIEYRNSPIYKTVMAIRERLKVKCPEIQNAKGPFTSTTRITLTVSSYEHDLIEMHRKIEKENNNSTTTK